MTNLQPYARHPSLLLPTGHLQPRWLLGRHPSLQSFRIPPCAASRWHRWGPSSQRVSSPPKLRGGAEWRCWRRRDGSMPVMSAVKLDQPRPKAGCTLTLAGSRAMALSASCIAYPYDSSLIFACGSSSAGGRVQPKPRTRTDDKPGRGW
jgi:hypothetical protein